MSGKKRFFHCSVEGCDRPYLAKGFCSMHYQRQKLMGDVGGAEPLVMENEGHKCSIDGCEDMADTKGLCPYHYTVKQGHGDPNHETRYRSPDKRENAYVLLRVGGKVIPEHRLVMEEYLGCKLLSHENIHHRNGRRNDNRISNLELWVTKQPKGQRPSDLIEYAKEILEQYADESTALEVVELIRERDARRTVFNEDYTRPNEDARTSDIIANKKTH